MTRLITILTLFLGLKTLGCSCSYEISEFSPYDLIEFKNIFECKTISVKTEGIQFVYTVVISKTYWGDKKDTVQVWTFQDRAACSYTLELNEAYLLYAFGDERLQINSCGPSRQLTGNKVGFLDNWKPTDSLLTTINGVYKKYPIAFIQDFFQKTTINEIKFLELISKTKTGKLVTKFANGSISGEINIVDKKLNGPSVFYYPNGKLKATGSLKNNSREGLWTYYHFVHRRNKSDLYYSDSGKCINNESRGRWKTKIIIGTKKDFESLNVSDSDYK
jgi:hypothetical protein